MKFNIPISKKNINSLINIVFILILLFFLLLLSPDNYANEINTNIDDKKIQKILIVVALDKEAKPIIAKLNLHKSQHHFDKMPMQGYVGKYANFDIFLITNGTDPLYNVQNIGTQPATLSTYLGISYFHPDLVINIGTAGGIAESGAQIGDIYISRKIYFIDRRMPNSGYSQYGFGGYISSDTHLIGNEINLKKGIICSGDSFDKNDTDYQIILKNRCAARDMEAAAVAWVSMLTTTPMFAIKGITHIVGSKNAKEQFDKRILSVSKLLSKNLQEFLDKLSNNNLWDNNRSLIRHAG
ncbi:5'-methylthioadenosine/S-adenosylhomocysteine nucleosidase [Legionella massiliensis]|uniref:5'-methylthioadenosine/S-adenosylhomocysteine nucleosidase n=1 Tax=Legionella massiliensis TaxID=1034943 RepID=A0A078L2A4_9GAMM|nr:hypothetical protein [Legionella massiliensis]CDZ79352.1 5'-methylthioadenosine/S-adenosylhomocysteine nucleosidase [Legionella massiliensis]CEE15090.1 5'-methylthioadenosine/S-adenosylhomocysteine nucleosidase [Legionella massiliensis]